jgi:hypothetical protein
MATQLTPWELLDDPAGAAAPEAAPRAGVASRALTGSVSEPAVGDERADHNSRPLLTQSPGEGRAKSSSGWALPAICIGIAILACCLIIPQADSNHRLVFEREKLRNDLQRLDMQISVNDEFLERAASDPALAERLAQRQMKMVRQGTSVLELPDRQPRNEMSPFLLTTVPPAPPLPEYRPTGGIVGELFNDAHMRLYLIGASLMLMAVGIVLGAPAQD